MKTKNHILFAAIILSIISCTTSSNKITDINDYAPYLNLTENKTLIKAQQENKFWKEKLQKSPNQFPYLVKIASSYNNLFETQGTISDLKEAEKNLIQANQITNYKNSTYLRSLARNYISQHKFKEALELLTKAEINGDKLEATQKMLFDVHLELGNYTTAQEYMIRFKDFSDFDYLIRFSKWCDHKGNLGAAIKYMEKAKKIAESSNIPSIKQWVYTNLADYYGHAGLIKKSYNHYLKALQLNPNDAYSKKGIAWIVYSHEKNPDEALRILNRITTNYNAPDYYLLKAEIAEFKGDVVIQKEQLNLYHTAMKNSAYGDMYNKYNVLLYSDEPTKIKEAIALAEIEINNRPTPQSYDLLAWAHFNNGELKKALKIVENHVIDKTSEPEVLYHIAEIYKANGKTSEIKELKKELLASVYELGPIMEQEIKKI